MSISAFEFTCRKRFREYPCCHRQWRHPGHCHFVHGYSRGFTFWFGAKKPDENGFVVDFSGLKILEQKIASQFDHTFLVNHDDPLLSKWEELHKEGALDLRIMKNVGMESSAKLVWEWANSFLLERDAGRTCCWRSEASENSVNSASFELIPSWFNSSQ
tara:strand:- start:67 stop:543 length:477 start_codon:yes stop_codon:yes gene_type:complete